MRFTRTLLNLSTHIDYFSKYQPTSFTLKHLIDFARDGDVQQSFKYLRVELLIRWAHMRKEMDYLPTKLVEMPSFRLANSWYDQSFSEILNYKNVEMTSSVLRDFTENLVEIRRRHAKIVQTLAQAYMEYEKTGPITSIEKNRIQYFYDRFFMNRIAVRTLIYQHTLLFGEECPPHPQRAGMIDPAVDVVAVIQDAYETAKHLFQSGSYPVAPIEIVSHNAQNDRSNKVTFVYIPSHLYHIVFELLKNSLRATMERFGANQKELPPIRILVVKGRQDLTIEISDQGGGIPRSKLSKVFHYTYSTAPKPQSATGLNSSNGTAIAGLGYGLPIARLYARYFQGNLDLASIEDLGTSAFVTLKATAEDSREFLPVFSRSRYNYTTNKGSDWTVQLKN